MSLQRESREEQRPRRAGRIGEKNYTEGEAHVSIEKVDGRNWRGQKLEIKKRSEKP